MTYKSLTISNVLFVISLVLAGFDVPIKVFSFYEIKPIYFVFVCCLFLNVYKIYTSKILSRTFVFYLVYIVLFSFVRRVTGQSLYSSYIFIFHFLIYSYICLSLYSYGRKVGIFLFAKLLKLTISIYLILLFIDLITLPFGFSIYGAIMASDTYRFGQLFSSEPNWLTVHFVTICVMYIMACKEASKREGSTLFAGGAIGVDLCLNSSRAAIILIIGLVPVLFKRQTIFFVVMFFLLAFLVLFACILFLSVDFLEYLPYEMIYDIVSLERNPRINDALFIVPQIGQRIWFGIGYGDLELYTASMSWRESYPVVNQMWLQVLGMSGVLGMIWWLVVVGYLAFNLKGFFRAFVLLYFLFMQLHNSLFMPLPYVALSLLVVTNSFSRTVNSRRVRKRKAYRGAVIY